MINFAIGMKKEIKTQTRAIGKTDLFIQELAELLPQKDCIAYGCTEKLAIDYISRLATKGIEATCKPEYSKQFKQTVLNELYETVFESKAQEPILIGYSFSMKRKQEIIFANGSRISFDDDGSGGHGLNTDGAWPIDL